MLAAPMVTVFIFTPSMMEDTNLSLARAREILAAFSCLTPKAVADAAERQQLQQALQAMVRASDWENLGICADDLAAAQQALASYLQALGHPATPPIAEPPEGEGPIYLKYNTQRQLIYCDCYSGDYRGVLVACQSENEAVAGTYGYLPLDLYS